MRIATAAPGEGDEEDDERLRAALARLERSHPEAAELMRLRLQGLSNVAAAEQAGLPLRTVLRRLALAKMLLRQELRRGDDPQS